MANWYQDQLTNKNFLSPIGFVFLLERARKCAFLCQKATIEGKPMLTVDAKCEPHGSSSPSPAIIGTIIEGSPTSYVKCDDGVYRKVARIGDSLDCGCKIVGGAKTVGAGANA